MAKNTVTEKAPRITKAMKYADIIAILEGQPQPHSLSSDYLVDFLKNEVALLAKKNSGDKSASAEKKAKENKGYQDAIYAFLTEQTEAVTYMTIIRGVEVLAEFSPQKIVPIMRGMVEDGRIKKEMVKGKAVFSIA